MKFRYGRRRILVIIIMITITIIIIIIIVLIIMLITITWLISFYRFFAPSGYTNFREKSSCDSPRVRYNVCEKLPSYKATLYYW